MDKIIEKKRFNKKTLLMLSGILVFLGLVAYGYSLSLHKVYQADLDKMSVSKVIYGDFEDVALCNASVVPLTSVIVSSPEGGTVAEIFTENGASVVKGTPLLRIANPNALSNYTSSETSITEQINQLRKVRLDLEQNQRVMSQDLMVIENSLRTASRKYRTDSLLFAKSVITREEFVASSQDYEYFLGRKDILKQAIKQENQSRVMQLRQIDESVTRMNESLQTIRQNIENMTIKAPVAGRLSSYDPVIGKSYAVNEMLGKIDVMQGYKLQAVVDEYYVNRVKEGQKASCEFNGQTYALTVRKVIPEVTAGQFQIELVFDGKSPDELRRGLSLQVKLTLSNNSKSLLLAQGQFFQSTGGTWVFVIKDGKATKRNVKVGRKNFKYYEVIDGLQKDEEVITSSYDQFSQYDIIQIK
ncbi:efflux RND transporter periplasmic adaptor subunit [Pedobacter sp. MC2016-24]|jgi:HlyD family secretion protein|uniref:efflux RND transporter periplasmic adaptor subunit n=1 Tax=Pedobacter sp. MC2016-24 TaxID=2780090 RepID=UPI00188240FC|nr:HlyD family efflux transporter periplasmic adaptor subunit [Pedobacter sp. MC2016-24]MBE9602764.1 HlyD family efflux transporter periplasmic adaptor subunit [Pedobacter sp. MC2016-24]